MTSNGSNAQQCHQNTDSFYSAILNLLALCSCLPHETLGITSRFKALMGKGLTSHTLYFFRNAQVVFLARNVSHGYPRKAEEAVLLYTLLSGIKSGSFIKGRGSSHPNL